jgi:TonB family protein
MNGALIYRPTNRKLVWIAFACAITIHLSAIAIAGNRSKPVFVSWDGDPGESPIMIMDPETSAQDEVSPPEQVMTSPDEEAFPPETATPIRPRKKTPVTAVRSTNIGTGRATSVGSTRALTLYAPKPNYPYEARRSGITGSGVAQLTVNSAAGNVLAARMAQSTGNAILDNATVETLRRWRFKPGVAANVDVSITYTLGGVSY